MIIDAHHHLWDTSRREYPFLRDIPELRGPYTVDDLGAVTAGRVRQTVLVQTIADAGESAEFLRTAQDSAGLIAGVVGWVEVTAPDVAEQIAALRAGPGGDLLVGIRYGVQGEPDPDWLLRAEVLRGLAAVAAAGLVFDLLVRVPQLPAAALVAQRLPELSFVLDHLGKPGIGWAEWQPWAAGLAALAAQPNVTGKLSGLVTEARPDRWGANALRRYAGYALEVFGPHRLMFGSDWPVCTLVTGYGGVLDLAGELTAGLDPASRTAVFADTARRVYRL